MRKENLMIFHKHKWEDKSSTIYWEYPGVDRSVGGRNYHWEHRVICQDKNPGVEELVARGWMGNAATSYPTPYSIVAQQCSTCNKWRSTYLDGAVRLNEK